MPDDKDIPSAYVKDKRTPTESREELRARIPGWGVDLDPADRPSNHRLHYAPDTTGAHWDFPERQPEKWPREHSIEHAFVTPVFGTAQPPKGLSGVIRKFSYARYGEARLGHWLLLILADRVDAWEEHLRSFATTRPDNPITETGVKAEYTHGGLASRKGRVDARHHLLDPLVVAGPWVAAAGGAVLGVRKLVRAVRR
ncbi:hypothetical protein [Blastococcus haudaquaticus]|uniref:Uncharacterized protein n=1 Tax=Blastococcus haudaquaticus TaxID=1938745 RepID=A0A286GRP9_9ACTN|nr:hypothetical protein [Blastococcus haudaquaticus]SOD98213.1 hypothetical protein SAMN06272739_1787 [Blastococcus haudaquaticus]